MMKPVAELTAALQDDRDLRSHRKGDWQWELNCILGSNRVSPASFTKRRGRPSSTPWKRWRRSLQNPARSFEVAAGLSCPLGAGVPAGQAVYSGGFQKAKGCAFPGLTPAGVVEGEPCSRTGARKSRWMLPVL